MIFEQPHHGRRVGHGNVPRRLCAAAIEVLVRGVERDGEEAPGMPLEGLLLLLTVPDGGSAGARDYINGKLIHVMLCFGLASRLDLDH